MQTDLFNHKPQVTSLLAYRDIQPELGQKQMQVFSLLQEHRALCNQQIAKLLGWEINRVTPRVQELREQGLVEEKFKDKYTPTNRLVIYWGLK